MKTRLKRLFLALLIWALMLVPAPPVRGDDTSAEAPPPLSVHPDIREFSVNTGPKELRIRAREDGADSRWTWRLTGPGRLLGEPVAQEISYIPPDDLATPTATAVVTATRKTADGATDSTRVIFALTDSGPTRTDPVITPTPSPAQSLTPSQAQSPTPSQAPDAEAVQEAAAAGPDTAPDEDAAADAAAPAEDPDRLLSEALIETGPSGEVGAETAMTGTTAKRPGIETTMTRTTAKRSGIETTMTGTGTEPEAAPAEPGAGPPETAPAPLPPPARPETPLNPPSETTAPPAAADTPSTEAPLRAEMTTDERVAQLIHEGDRLMERRQYTIPREENAFDRYRAALGMDPSQPAARERIRQLARIYKSLGDAALAAEETLKAEQLYQRYAAVAAYAAETLGMTDLQPELSAIRDRLSALGRQGRSVAELTRLATDHELAGRYALPEGENALWAYRKVLALEPRNSRVRERIDAMLKIVKLKGDAALKQKDYADAIDLYRQYLAIEPSASHDRDPILDIQTTEVRDRLRAAENLRVIEGLNRNKETFSRDLAAYRDLRDRENRGDPVGPDIIAALTTLIPRLRDVESAYGKLSASPVDLSEPQARARAIREELEKELAIRKARND